MRLLAPALLLALAVPAATAVAETPAVAEATKYYPQDANGAQVLDAALAMAAGTGQTAIIVFGADWCHDSRSLAQVLKSDRFTTEFGARYAVTFIDVGKPQTGEGRNLDLLARFGVRDLKSTPALFAISPRGKRINGKSDAKSWRNAHSRGEDAILDWFRNLPRKD